MRPYIYKGKDFKQPMSVFKGSKTNLQLQLESRVILNILAIGVLLLWHIPAYAQQLPHYSLIQENPYYYNPAAASMGNTLELNAGYRDQWRALPDSPTQYMLSGHLPIYSINSSLGFLYESDNLGPESLGKFGLSMGYVLPTPIGLFSLSGRAFYQQLQFRGSQLISGEGNYEGGIVDHNDPLLPNSDLSSPGMSFDIGLWFRTSSYEIGLSYNSLYHSGFNLTGVSNYRPAGVIVLFGQHVFRMNDEIDLRSSLLIKSDFVALQSQVAISCSYKQTYFIGTELTGYNSRSLEELGLNAGLRINKYVTFAYQYGIGLSELRRISNGSHEIGLRFSLGKPLGGAILPQVIYNPRFVE